MKLSERIRKKGGKYAPDALKYVPVSQPTLNVWANEVAQLEAENAAAFELLDVYEKENERLRDGLLNIRRKAPAMENMGYGDLCGEYDCCHDMHAIAVDALKEGE